MNTLTELTKAILLLTSDFLKDKEPKISPLNADEWGRFSKWLNTNSLSPLDLLKVGFEEKLLTWNDAEIPLDRIKLLMNRGVALSLAFEKWQKMGIWVITKAPEDKKYYPKRIKDVCRHNAPPILYGVGNRDILNRSETIGFLIDHVLSDYEKEYLKFHVKSIGGTQYVLAVCELEKKNVFLVDEALNAGVNIIMIVSNDLVGAALNKKYRNALMQNQLVIISPYYPEVVLNEINNKITNSYYNALTSLSLGFSKYVPVMENIESDKTVNVLNDADTMEEEKPKQGTFEL